LSFLIEFAEVEEGYKEQAFHVVLLATLNVGEVAIRSLKLLHKTDSDSGLELELELERPLV
jgi:hypothetical protein